MNKKNTGGILSLISKGLVTCDSRTGARNYDEFNSDTEITKVIQKNPLSILRVTMAHCDPRYSGTSDAETMHTAKQNFQNLIDQKIFTHIHNFVTVYRITHPSAGRPVQIGLGCMMHTDAIYDPVSNPSGRIIRNEAIYDHKAMNRAQLIQKTRSMIGAVNICAEDPNKSFLNRLLSSAVLNNCPDVRSEDDMKNVHEVWVITDTKESNELLEAACTGEFYVADGNHRSRAAALSLSEKFFAVVFPASSMHIDPYHRLIRSRIADTNDFISRMEQAGFSFTGVSTLPTLRNEPVLREKVYMYFPACRQLPFSESGLAELTLPECRSESPREKNPASIIEKILLHGILNLDPGSGDVAYIGGDYPESYLFSEVDKGAASAAVFMPSLTMPQFISINKAREMLPRKTTWFTPKVRSGLVIALLP